MPRRDVRTPNPGRSGVEGAAGLGLGIAQRLFGQGEDVLDVPATLAARARLLSTGHDPRDAEPHQGDAFINFDRDLSRDREERVACKPRRQPGPRPRGLAGDSFAYADPSAGRMGGAAQ